MIRTILFNWNIFEDHKIDKEWSKCNELINKYTEIEKQLLNRKDKTKIEMIVYVTSASPKSSNISESFS